MCLLSTGCGEGSPSGQAPRVRVGVGSGSEGSGADTFQADDRPEPQGEFTSGSAGGDHSCGVRSDSTVVCWGYNGVGRAVAPLGSFTAVAESLSGFGPHEELSFASDAEGGRQVFVTRARLLTSGNDRE